MKRICRIAMSGCLMALICGCSDFSDDPPGRIYLRTISETQALIDAQMAEKHIVGLSIALIDAEASPASRLVWARGFGMADKESGKPASADTLYCIGSSSKTITAVALLRQCDRGKVDLDWPLQDIIPDFALQIRYPDIGQNGYITPRTLLNMHAGVPGDMYNGLFILSDPWYGKYMHWLLAYLQTDYPSHPPGALASYGNIGIVLAGHAAYLAGRSEADADFQAFVKRTVLDPLGMRSTCSEVRGRDLPDLAVPYFQGVPDESLNTNGTATGGFYSTVKDMGRFIEMLLRDGRLPDGMPFLQADTVREMGKIDTTDLDIHSYYQPGLGLDSMSLPAFYGVAPPRDGYGRAWSKNGSTGSYNAMIMLLPDTGLKLGVVVLSNSDTAADAVYTIARACLLAAVREKLGRRADPSPRPLPDFSGQAIIQPSEIVGHYGSATGYFDIERRDNQLRWINDPGQDENAGLALTLESDGSNAFAVEGKGWDVVFVDRTDIHGNTYRLMVRTGGVDERFGPNAVFTLGQKIASPGVLSQAWQDRIDQVYVADQMLEFGFDPYLTFAFQDDLLLARTSSATAVIDPQNDDLAWVGDSLSRGDAAIRVLHEANGDRLFYLANGYFPIGQVKEYVLGDEESFDLQLRNGLPLSVWRKITVPPGSAFEGRNVRFTAAPGDERDTYSLYGGNLGLVGFAPGPDGAVFRLDAGTYYLVICPGAKASGERVLACRPAD